jgi:hypothetical protein
MALVSYQNYTFPLRGLSSPTPGASLGLWGQTTVQAQTSWLRRNWGSVLQILGSLFVVSGTIIQQWINSNAPVGEQITTDDWEMMVQAVQRLYPQLSRQQIEAKLCEVFGTRSPYCLPGGQVYPAPPVTTTGIPSWIWLVAIGAGAFLLFK